MKRPREVLSLLAAAAVFGTSLFLFGRVMGLTSPWFALVVMFCFLGLLGIARPLLALRLPGCLREMRAWEMGGRLYPVLGVPVFGALLRRRPLRYLQPLVYLNRYPGDPMKVQNQIEGAEAAHFWAAALLVPYMVYACVQKWWSVLVCFILVQLVGNVYPILHLRWVRGRLKRVFERKRPTRAAGNP
jgi:hypothetical protein